MSTFEPRRLVQGALATLALWLPWMSSTACVPSGACLRNSDCPSGQACREGECTFLSASAVVSSPRDGSSATDAAPRDVRVVAPPPDAASVTPLTDR